MKIEKMQKEHIPAVAAIAADSLAEAWSESAFGQELENPSSSVFVAVIGDEAIGFGGVQKVLDEAYINNIAVKDSFRRKGAGAAILDAIVKDCAGCAFVTLEVRVSNVAAIKLYEKSGFMSQGIRKGFYSHPTEDANIMTLFLGE